MKFLIYTFLLFSLAPLGLAKGSGKGCGDPCNKKSCCVKMYMAERQSSDILTDIKGLFTRDDEEVDSEKL